MTLAARARRAAAARRSRCRPNWQLPSDERDRRADRRAQRAARGAGDRRRRARAGRAADRRRRAGRRRGVRRQHAVRDRLDQQGVHRADPRRHGQQGRSLARRSGREIPARRAPDARAGRPPDHLARPVDAPLGPAAHGRRHRRSTIPTVRSPTTPKTQLLAFLDRYQLPRDIGSQWEYSNLGVGLLGYLLGARGGLGLRDAAARADHRPARHERHADHAAADARGAAGAGVRRLHAADQAVEPGGARRGRRHPLDRRRHAHVRRGRARPEFADRAGGEDRAVGRASPGSNPRTEQALGWVRASIPSRAAKCCCTTAAPAAIARCWRSSRQRAGRWWCWSTRRPSRRRRLGAARAHRLAGARRRRRCRRPRRRRSRGPK